MSNFPGPPIGYVDILDGHTLEKTEKEASGPRTYSPLRPSAAGQCSRELAYGFMEYRGKAKYPKELKMPDTERLLKLGHSIEWNIVKQFEEIELFRTKYRQQVVSFFKITPEEWCEGSIDFVFWSEKWKCVGDIKSKKDKFSSWTASQWDETTEMLRGMATVKTITDKAFWIEDLSAFLSELRDPFLAANFYQLNMYAQSDFLVERGIDHAVVIQYNKNDSRLREIRFRPSRAVYEQTKSKFLAVQNAVDEHSDPERVPKDYGLGSFKCAYCDFKKECWGEEDALKALYATWPKKEWPKDTGYMGADGQQLEQLFAEYVAAEKSALVQEAIEEEITKILESRKINKVKTADGKTYELKFLKSPKPHFAIRRCKP
jgi:hypothetical protein